ncbi:ABC transporter substrate-binding protein [Candidatus Vallotia cooleyia]|uniref:ABC transporter substrate-binding protein n=1 Tax=Candidatus Vallotiella adelgis TaxID=1177211 RepID=UPI001D026E1D|nr:ABC transporter substrate-binding protein [Candidatus Vallotia cooleyia]
MLLITAPAWLQAKPLIVCTEASPDGFDIVRYNSLTTSNASGDVIFNQLVRYDEATSMLAPSLADRWKVSPNGLSAIFNLHPNVSFQTTEYFKPSRTLNADDVLFTFHRMLDPHHPWHKIVGNSGFPHAQSMNLPKLIKSVTKIDDLTVKFELSEPNAAFVSILTMPFASIYSAEYASQLEVAGRQDRMNSRPVGTGPFILKSYTDDAVIRYDVNPTYWGRKPQINQLIYSITPDAAVRAQKIKSGECQIALSPKPQHVLAAREDKLLKVVQTPAFMTAFVALNTQHKPLDNNKVRKALNIAFDRKTYIKTVFSDTAVAAVNPYPPNTWSYNKEIEPYTYNIEQAKQLLSDAGYPNGFEAAIWVRSSGSVLNPNPKAGAELLQADLNKIGIKTQIKVVEWGQLIQDAKQGQHDLLFMGWSGDNSDPDNFLTPQFSCASAKAGINFTRYCNPQLDKWIADGKRTTHQPTRTKLYVAAQKMIHDKALWIPLAYPSTAVLMRNNVSGYRPSLFGRQDYSNVKIN